MTAPGLLIDAGEVDLDGFERALGDPADPGALISYAGSAELDRREEFPARICGDLDRLGLPRLYVPAEHGGALTRYDDLLAAVRSVARRDLSVAIGHAKSFLGGASVWVAGTPEQARALGADIMAGVPVSWGLTERGHGSDLLAGEMTAAREGAGYRVRGEKWLINNATRGSVLCLLVRTSAEGGERGFSLLLADKRRLPADRYRHLPKVRTLGIRGADISGFALDDCPVPADALVGAEGGGLETVLKALQLTRTVCAALSLGAADQALRLATGFAARRDLYGHRLIELPHVRRTLGECYAALFTAEAVSVLGTRLVHTLPEEMAVVSAAVKSFVPARVDALLAACGEILGARAFLTGVHEHGAFQKLERDHRVVGIFDGSTLVNQHALINHFPLLAAGHRRGGAHEDELRRAADLSSAPPAAALDRLTLLSRGGCSLTRGLRATTVELHAMAARGEAPVRLAELADELTNRCDRLHGALALVRPAARDVPPEHFALARRYELCLAGAAVLRLWTHNRARGDDPLWPEACLALLLRSLRPLGRPAEEEVFDRLLDAVAAGRPVGPRLGGAR